MGEKMSTLRKSESREVQEIRKLASHKEQTNNFQQHTKNTVVKYLLGEIKDFFSTCDCRIVILEATN